MHEDEVGFARCRRKSWADFVEYFKRTGCLFTAQQLLYTQGTESHEHKFEFHQYTPARTRFITQSISAECARGKKGFCICAIRARL